MPIGTSGLIGHCPLSTRAARAEMDNCKVRDVLEYAAFLGWQEDTLAGERHEPDNNMLCHRSGAWRGRTRVHRYDTSAPIAMDSVS